MDETLIHYTDIEIHQQELCVLSDVNLQLHKGKFVYLVDKVGSDKTSLLKTFYGKLDVASDEAEVLSYRMTSIRRRYIPQSRHKLGIVFQGFQLLTGRTMNDSLEFVLHTTGWKSKRGTKERIAEVLNLVGTENRGYKLPSELSDGEQQRIVIARTVLDSPEIILADGPIGNLGVETRKAIVELLYNICQAGSLVVMITHDLQLVTEYPEQVYQCAEHRVANVTGEFVKKENN